MRRIIVIGLLSATSFLSFGQTDDFREINFRFSNDFTHMTDRYYTNGLYADITLPVFNKNPVNWLFVSPKSYLKYSTISITQDFFTPDFSIEELGSRPFASYLLIGFKHEAINPTTGFIISSEFQAGLIGQNSGGELLQNWTHNFLPGADPVSWANQIRNDVALSYGILVEKQAFQNDFAQISLSAEGVLGTPFTRASTGVHLKLGQFEDRFAPKGSLDKKWQWYLYSDFRAMAVLHNATIEGGLFADNPYTRADMNPWVFNIETGIGVNYKNLGLKIGQQFLTPEFYFGESHFWGYFNIGYRF